MRYITFYLLLHLISCNTFDNGNIPTGETNVPSFKILLPDSTTLVSTENLDKGKPLILFYFLPNCPYCRVLVKDIIENISHFKNVSLFMITPAKYSLMKSFYEEFQLNRFTNISIGKDYKNSFRLHFEPKAVPFVVVYNSLGVLKTIFTTKPNISEIEKAVV